MVVQRVERAGCSLFDIDLIGVTSPWGNCVEGVGEIMIYFGGSKPEAPASPNTGFQISLLYVRMADPARFSQSHYTYVHALTIRLHPCKQ